MRCLYKCDIVVVVAIMTVDADENITRDIAQTLSPGVNGISVGQCGDLVPL